MIKSGSSRAARVAESDAANPPTEPDHAARISEDHAKLINLLEKSGIDDDLIYAILPIYGRCLAMRSFPPHPSITLRRKSIARLSKLTKQIRTELDTTVAEADLFMGGNDSRGNNIFIATKSRLKDFDEIIDRAREQADAANAGAPSDIWAWAMVEELVLLLEHRGLPINKKEDGILIKILTVLLPATSAPEVDTVIRKLVKHKRLSN